MIPDSQNLTFNEYQTLSKATAQFPTIDTELADACLKLLSSTAMIAGVVKKIYRDSEGEISTDAEIKLSAALLLASEDLEVVETLFHQRQSKRPGSCPDPRVVYPLLGYADEVGELIEKCLEGDLKGARKESGDAKWYAGATDTALGITSGSAAEENLIKVLDRLERGVIKGSGDNR